MRKCISHPTSISHYLNLKQRTSYEEKRFHSSPDTNPTTSHFEPIGALRTVGPLLFTLLVPIFPWALACLYSLNTDFLPKAIPQNSILNHQSITSHPPFHYQLHISTQKNKSVLRFAAKFKTGQISAARFEMS